MARTGQFGTHLAPLPDVGIPQWQALQVRLREARAAIETGDQTRALEAVDAALAIDPEFLAAQALRDRILSASDRGSPSTDPAPATAIDTTEPEPVAPTDGYVKFEQRALRRRLDRQLGATREAIAAGRVQAAAATLDEVIDLAPDEPDVAELSAALNNLRRSLTTRKRNTRLAATAVFTALVFGAMRLGDQRMLGARPTTPASSRSLPTLEPPVVSSPAATPQAIIEIVSGDSPVSAVSPQAPVTAVVAAPIIALPAPSTLPTLLAVQVMIAAAPGSASIPEAEVTAVPPPREDDEGLMQEVLHRYRRAYEELDADAARAVWPSVNQAALAQAFDGLTSQTLTFESCDLRARGEVADATCRGTARYVRKIGSPEPRTERRVWHFALRRVERDWRIESARVDR